MSEKKTINVKGREIAWISDKVNDYISLTDMARYKDSDRTNYVIQNWMRTRSAIEFCGLWKQLNNSDFKSIEFEGFKKESKSTPLTIKI
jgi:KilA-N domain